MKKEPIGLNSFSEPFVIDLNSNLGPNSSRITFAMILSSSPMLVDLAPFHVASIDDTTCMVIFTGFVLKQVLTLGQS